jgi:hypothetical protein
MRNAIHISTLRFRTKLNSEHLLNWKFFFIILTILTGAGLAMSTNNSGLDASWWMLTVNAARFGLIQKSEFIGTYGPLGFFDFALVTWKMGLILNLIWKVFITTWLFLKIWAVIAAKQKIGNFSLGVLTTLFVSAINYFLPPSQALVVIILCIFVAEYFEGSDSKSLGNLQILLLSGLTSILFLVKLFPGTLALSLSMAVILQRCYTEKRNLIEVARILLKYFSGLILLVFGILLLLGFNTSQMINWLYASAQMTVGYKAMAWEDPGRWWEYFAFFSLIIPLVFFKKLKKHQWFVMAHILFFYFLFIYGFNRHDSHAIVAFAFLFIEYCLYAIYKKDSRVFVSAALSLIILLAVSGFSLSQFFDFSPRLQNTISYLKALDPRYAEQIVVENIRSLQNAYPMDKNLLDKIGGETVSIYPWDQLAANAWSLNLVSPPAPQLITAYTPWLDEQNVNWVNSKAASQFMLWTQPKSVDYRYPHWDSPAFQVATLCNYENLMMDENWILLKRRANSICADQSKEVEILSTDGSRTHFKIETNENKVTVMRIESDQSLFKRLQRTAFKPIRSDAIFVDGQRARLIWATKQNLIVGVPPGINYPAPYEYKTIQDIELMKPSKVFLTEIAINK